MLIDISKLKRTPGLTQTFRVEGDIEQVNTAKEKIKFIKPIEVSVKAENFNGRLIINGTLKAEVLLNCSRCLEDFTREIETEFEREFRISPDAHGEDVDEEVHSLTGETLKLDDAVIESILLELPMKQVCTEECRGLCKQCGINLNQKACDCVEENIDPRLEALKNFLKS